MINSTKKTHGLGSEIKGLIINGPPSQRFSQHIPYDCSWIPSNGGVHDGSSQCPKFILFLLQVPYGFLFFPDSSLRGTTASSWTPLWKPSFRGPKLQKIMGKPPVIGGWPLLSKCLVKGKPSHVKLDPSYLGGQQLSMVVNQLLNGMILQASHWANVPKLDPITNQSEWKNTCPIHQHVGEFPTPKTTL